MPSELDPGPAGAIDLCLAAHRRLLFRVEGITDEQARSPSRLPDWSVAHVLTHLARNADGHVGRLEGALRGEDVPRYPGGPAQRDADIAEGAQRPAAEIVADLSGAQDRLEKAWDRSAAAGWPHPELRGDDKWPTTASPLRRLGEVEIHHVDLGLGYEPSDWPEAYVAWQLPVLLATVPGRVRSAEDARRLLTWLAGRGSGPSVIELLPW